MKKLSIYIALILVFLTFFGCTQNTINLPEYSDSQCYYSEGFQDYTDFCKYYYDEESVENFASHSEFQQVTETDIEDIKSYFADFENRVKTEEYYKNYDFDNKTQIKTGDYFCIITQNSNDKFADYDVYYYDTEKFVLYFIHSNT